MPPRKRLGQLLTELKVIDEHQLQSALGHQKQWGGKLGAILVQKGFCREDQMVSALSQHLAMPAVRLSEVKIDPRAVKTVSRSVAERLHVFAYEVTGSGRSEVITIAMSDPTDLSAVDQLAFHTGKRIKPMLAGDSEVINAIQQNYASETPGQGVQPLPAGSRPFVEGAPRVPGSRLTPVAPMSPVPAAATPTPGFSRRVEPPRPPPPVLQVAAAAGAAVAVAGENGVEAPMESVGLGGEDLPADAPMEGLEPIAAHTQGEESVQGAEEVPGDDTTSDDVAGLVAVTSEAVSLETEDPAPTPAERGWTVTAELPVDAIMGTADVLETSPEGAATATDTPDAWSDIADPLAAAAGDPAPAPQEDAPAADAAPAEEGWSEGAAGESGATAESAWAQAAADVAAAAADLAAAEAESAPAGEGESLLAPPGDSYAPAEEVAIEAEGWSEDSTTADEPQAEAGAAGEAPFVMEEDTGPAEAEHSATQPQGWLSQRAADAGEQSDVASGEDAEVEAVYGEDAQEGAAYAEEAPAGEGYAEGDASGQEYVEEGAASDQGHAGESADESGYAEAGSTEEPRADEYGQQDVGEGESPAGSEGWIASPEDQPQAAGWFGDALSSTMPLSPADLGTLAAIGLDPSDAASAQRVLACLVRVLNRRQAIDLDELAAEIRESRIAGEAAGQAEVEEQPAGGDLGTGETGEAAE